MTDAPSNSPIQLHDMEKLLSEFRHDLRNKLSPAVMVADHLTHHADPEVCHEAKIIMESLDATLAIIKKIRLSQ